MDTLRRIFLALLMTTLLAPGFARADELELVLQSGHSRATRDALWIDDTHLASCSEDGSIKVWNLQERRVKRTMWTPPDEARSSVWGRQVLALEKTRDGLWALQSNGHLRLWNPDTGRLLKTVILPEGYESGDLKMVTGQDGHLYVYGVAEEVLRIAEGKVGAIKTPAKIYQLALRDPEHMVASVHKGLIYGSLGAPKQLPETHTNRWGVGDLLISPDGKVAFVATNANWLEVWDLDKAELRHRAPVNKNAVPETTLKGSGFSGEDLGFKLAFLNDSVVAGTYGGELTLVEMATGKVSPLVQFQQYGLNSLEANPGQTALVGGYGNTGDSSVPVAFKQGNEWKTDTLGGRGLSFTELKERDNTLFLSAGSNFVLTYDLESGQPKHTFQTGYYPHTCLGSDVLYAGGNDGILHAFNTTTGERLWEKAFTRSGAKFGAGVVALALSPDGRELALATLDHQPHLYLLDAASGDHKREIPIEKTLKSLTYSKDGRILFMSDYDKVSLYDLSYRKIIHNWGKSSSRLENFVTLMNHPTRNSLLGITNKGNLVEFDPTRLDVEPTVKSVLPTSNTVSMRADGANLLITADLGAYLVTPEGTLLKSYGHHLSTSTDALALEEVVLTTAYDSRVVVWNKETTKEMATLLALDQGRNWLFISSDFHFDGTEEAQNLIEWRWNGELYELARFFEKFYQPGLLARTIKPGDRAREAAPAPALGSQPPKVKILAPKPLDGGFYEIALSSELPLPKDAEVRLYHNGHRVAGESPYRIKAVPGENRLRASAYNSDRTVESEPDRLTFQGRATSAERTLHVFAAAVNDYPNRLDFAVQDAQSFVKAFEPGLYDKVNKVTLYDKEADKKGIVDALSAISCEPQDTLLVFLAGHGTIIDNRFHFIPHGGDGKASEQALSSVELGKILAQLPATRQVLFLDTCHAGASARDLAELLVEKETPLIASEQGAMLIKDQKVLARQAGTFLVAGSTPDATAAEVPELGHGLFTYAVLNGLQGDLGKDHEVTVNELLTYLNEKVPQLSLKFRGSRHGIWQFSAGQDFPIAKP